MKACSSCTTLHDAERSAPPAGKPMTRCECSGVAFAEVAELMDRGTAFQEVSRRTGCGGMCTACLPDLARYLKDHVRSATTKAA